MNDTFEQITGVFQETRHAHHQAFLEADGFDPEWPLWYAGYLIDKLPPLLEADLTKSELVYLLVYLHNSHQLEAPGSRWAHYYAKVLVDKYL